MTALGERVLFSLLPEKQSIDYLAMEGLPEDCIPSDDLRQVYRFALDYYHKSNRLGAPTPEVMRQTVVPGGAKSFYDLLLDHDIQYGELPTESMQWAVEDLRASYLSEESQRRIRALAESISGADSASKLEALSRGSVELVALAQELDPRRTRVDFTKQGSDILMDYERRRDDLKSGIEGMTFGLPEVDHHTGGIRPGELALLAGYAKQGKAQPLDAKVLTSGGWRAMGELRVGDFVVGEDGRPVKVVAVHPRGKLEIFRVVMSDGSSTRVCGEHLWKVGYSRNNRCWSLRTTEEVRERLARGSATYIPICSPVEFPGCELPIDPYVLGLLIGDGGMTAGYPTFTTADTELLKAVDEYVSGSWGDMRAKQAPSNSYTYNLTRPHGSRTPNPLKEELKAIGIWGLRDSRKHLPATYLTSPIETRLALLQGLLDADGSAESGGSLVKFRTTSERLSRDVAELVWSLGGTAFRHHKIARAQNGRGQVAWIISIKIAEELGCPFRLERKARLWHAWKKEHKPKLPSRRIVRVLPIGEQEARCITVESPSGLYLTDDFIVTHNSFWIAKFAINEWHQGRSVALFTLENSIEMTQDRIACMTLGISQSRFSRGQLTPQEEEVIRRWVKETLQQSTTPLYILSPEEHQRSAESIVTKARLLGVDSLIIDQLSFMTPRDLRQQRYLQIREMMHDLKNMISTRTPRLPCVLAHQINREGWGKARKDGYYQLENMAEGSEVERTADWVFSVLQDEAHRASNSTYFQVLASRRRDLKAWDCTFAIDVGVIRVQRERSPG
jgi:replicative DNA helicase